VAAAISASDPRLHFGLGTSRTIERLEVIWPSGRRDRFASLAADRGDRLREGDPVPALLPVFPAGAAAR
jgi:hypothetical protein